MSRSLKTRVAYLVMGTVTVAGMTGAFGAAAFAEEGDTEVATSGAAFTGYAQSLLASDDVQAVATDADGNVVLYTTAAVDEIDNSKARSLLQSTSNLVVKMLDAPLETYDAEDVVGGAGYAAFENEQATSIGLCSVGFTGWTPKGEPAVVSAGHCTHDGVNAMSGLTLPSGDTAGGGAADGSNVRGTALLATLGFSQYGGPGNSTGTRGDVTSVDISVWDVDNPALNLLPEVTDWTTSASEDLSGSTYPVKSVGEAVVGAAVSKSGRTTGFTSGTVQSVKGWSLVSGREVYGFMSVLASAEGDSGGSMTQGNAAVGVVSGGVVSDGVSYVWGADLKAGLALTDGYSVALQLDKPTVTSGNSVFADSVITGTGNAGAKLNVTPSTGEPFSVRVDANGVWSFPAGKVGAYTYSIYTQRGFDKSAVVDFSVVVTPAPLPTPAFTSVAEGQNVATSVTSISGTGTAGATVTLSGDVDGTATVAADGTWTVKTQLGYGSHTVAAVQTRAGSLASTPATVSFAVVPVAPVITSPASGTSYAYGSGPTIISGTGVDGAQVAISVNGTVVRTVEVVDGAWTANLKSQFAVGAITISAAQTIEGATGPAVTSAITITPAVAGVTPTKPAAPAGNGKGVLASTGADVAPVLGGALGLLIVGMMLFVVRRVGIARRK
jgi:hypothetical protein